MKKKTLRWPDFKNIIESKNLEFQGEATADGYTLFAFDGPIEYDCEIDEKDANFEDEKADYENNYAVHANQRLSSFVHTKEFPVFASKVSTSGEKFFHRLHGVEITLDGSGSATEYLFSVPYAHAKLSGVIVINGLMGDNVDFSIYDTETGTISGIADKKLNQFGFNVFISEKNFRYNSLYDADLIQGLRIGLKVHPKDAQVRSIYANIILHELK